MPATVLQLNKVYKGNAPLINSMVRPHSEEFQTVACYLSGTSDGKNGMETVAKRTIYCALPKKKLYWTRPSTVRLLAKIIDEHEVDLVVCQFRRTIPIGVLAVAVSAKKPQVIGVLHGIVGGRVGWSRKLVNLFFYRRLDRLVSVSRIGVKDILQHNLALDPDKLVAIPNGLVETPFLAPSRRSRAEVLGPRSEAKFVFVMVGRLAPVKNHERTLQAFAKLSRAHGEARLFIVGSGPEEPRLRKQIEELDLQERVQLLGQRGDVAEILKHADCYLMPSLREGLPMALMEAMASGLPVITSGVKGMRELVPEETYGLLVEPESVDSIGGAMERAINLSAKERRQMGERARQRILEHFTARHMAESYEALYRNVLTKNAADRGDRIEPRGNW